jgi:hypothetical protein
MDLRSGRHIVDQSFDGHLDLVVSHQELKARWWHLYIPWYGMIRKQPVIYACILESLIVNDYVKTTRESHICPWAEFSFVAVICTGFFLGLGDDTPLWRDICTGGGSNRYKSLHIYTEWWLCTV